MHVIHLGTLVSVPPVGEPFEDIPVEVSEAGISEAPEGYILEVVPDPTDLNQGKPRCITYFIFESKL